MAHLLHLHRGQRADQGKSARARKRFEAALASFQQFGARGDVERVAAAPVTLLPAGHEERRERIT